MNKIVLVLVVAIVAGGSSLLISGLKTISKATQSNVQALAGE